MSKFVAYKHGLDKQADLLAEIEAKRRGTEQQLDCLLDERLRAGIFLGGDDPEMQRDFWRDVGAPAAGANGTGKLRADVDTSES